MKLEELESINGVARAMINGVEHHRLRSVIATTASRLAYEEVGQMMTLFRKRHDACVRVERGLTALGYYIPAQTTGDAVSFASDPANISEAMGMARGVKMGSGSAKKNFSVVIFAGSKEEETITGDGIRQTIETLLVKVKMMMAREEELADREQKIVEREAKLEISKKNLIGVVRNLDTVKTTGATIVSLAGEKPRMRVPAGTRVVPFRSLYPEITIAGKQYVRVVDVIDEVRRETGWIGTLNNVLTRMRSDPRYCSAVLKINRCRPTKPDDASKPGLYLPAALAENFKRDCRFLCERLLASRKGRPVRFLEAAE